MSSTPIYDELAATYLADLTPEVREPAGPEQPGQHALPPTTQTPPRSQSRKRPKV
ncbi:hypothetical protein [Saccharothrix deserti]|uniref:hypothetical protein n=1 Tax=Saccharothrix deserti TaxID=2593674 RepID=UPI00131D324A|nr:hypothetical protein [Saccharothrix deserti]